MKKACFITHPDFIGKKYEHPWKNMKFNSYERELEPGEGILNVKRSFAVDPGKKLSRVTVRATALGVFDMFIDGIRVVDFKTEDVPADEYKPGWTDYRRRVFEYEYDLTEVIAASDENEHLFAAEVSAGWWAGRISFGYYGFKPCAFCGEIEIEYKDGTSELIASGDDWEAAVCGPVLRADIWDGEYYDATIPEPSVCPEVHEWKQAVPFTDCTCEIVPQVGPTIKSRDIFLSPLSAVLHSGTVADGSTLGAIRVLDRGVGDGCEKMTVKKDQGLILDFGQNMVGRPVIMIKAPRGTKVCLYFAEMLNDSGEPDRGNDGPRGSMYIKNYRSAMARVVYVAAGSDEPELYFPTHSFFGFRYVEVRTDAEVEVLSVFGEVIGSDLEETGDFTCSDPEVNRLFSNVVWGMRGNYFSVPTDCPQRDERLGWTGDTQIFSGAAAYLADIDGFMHKWLGDARDSQQGYDGAYCDVIPRVFNTNNANAAWGDAGLVVPYKLWLMYGDTEIIREHYDSMEYYMKNLEQYGLEGPNTAYGDWLNYDVTDKRYIAVCYYAYDASLMEKFNVLLGKEDRAAYYRDLRGRIAAHWAERYVKDGELTVATQTGYLLALAFGLAEGQLRESFIARLREKIVENDYTLSTGFVGTGILNQTLSEAGLDDLAYSLLLQTRDPSWLYSVRQGATTMWERWNSYTLEKGFGDVGMNSFNHYAYGAVAEWMFAGMCGIRPDPEAPGFRHFILRPTPDLRKDEDIPAGQKRIDQASASYLPPFFESGSIESGWERVNGSMVYSFVIPGGLCARAEIIADGKMTINGIGMTAEQLGGRTENGRAVFELGSGKYRIVVG